MIRYGLPPCAFLALLCLSWRCAAGQSAAPAAVVNGVLRVHSENPRYFTDDGGRAIYLAGHQWFNDLQHNAWNSPVKINWDHYLDSMNERNLNYLRSWTVWSVGDPTAGHPSPRMPFRRTGPGKALDGRPKFDLHRFDPAFFERLRRQARAAGERGVYMSIMLFEVYGFMDRDGVYPASLWAGNVFHGPNNVNDVDTDENHDGHGLEFFFTSDPEVLDIQQAYVKRVIDAVNDLDNVFFEIANELEAKRWQYDMIRFVKRYEATRPKQHLVYMSPGGRDRDGRWSPVPKDDVVDSPADLYSVTRGWNKSYRKDPPVESRGKPVFMDMDHVAVDNDGDNPWNNNPTTPWKLLTRGYHQCMYDHDWWKPGTTGGPWETTRRNVGLTAAVAREMDLAGMSPRGDLSTTGYCLASPGREYVVFSPGREPFSVKGLLPGREYRFRWVDVSKARVVSQGSLKPPAGVHRFETVLNDAVLYLALGADAD
ncbi:MAG: DUF6298 domain-containing protein [Planctomycetota bacterium]|jgi:hypothetical protein